MAEVGLAAALTPPGERWREQVVSPSALADGVVAEPGDDERALSLVSSGTPLPGYEVGLCDADEAVGGNTRPVGRLGLSGPSVGTDAATGMSLVESDGMLRTGDRGFVEDGRVFVCGRTDDYLVANGRNMYAPVVESATGEVAGVRAGRVAAVGLPGGGWVVAAERSGRAARDGALDRVRRDVQRAAVDTAGARPDDVLLVPPGSLPLTSSGKLQRHVVQARVVKGELSADRAGGEAER